jgi:2-hydroxychromene-2-carboxylate isomerase
MAESMKTLEFWFDFASTYSYPAAMRVEAEAARLGVSVLWRPFLLGPLFAAQGWRDSPFNLYPAKGRYMWRDLERVCARLDLRFVRPAAFPQQSLLAARIATALPQAARPAFSRALFHAEFALGRSIADPATAQTILDAEIGAAAAVAAMAQAETPEIKAKLRETTERAAALGLPGAPCFLCADGEIFWGGDRLEDALAWEIGASRC